MTPYIGRNLSFPRDGDVVVSREAHSPVRYTIRQLPGVVQFSGRVRGAVLRLARGFGRKHAVDVWYNEGATFRLLDAYRPPVALVRQGGGR